MASYGPHKLGSVWRLHGPLLSHGRINRLHAKSWNITLCLAEPGSGTWKISSIVKEVTTMFADTTFFFAGGPSSFSGGGRDSKFSAAGLEEEWNT
ncbi:hypothetical protein VNO77_03288 [Canavalia gladiata]|uniref:Uncharacterized protein n=1 Tax=Canavalia gladiata TaxID=3824 RepID=A0AAN9MUG5_CANGL